jgi:hypothetical protein
LRSASGQGPLHGHDREDEWFHVLDGELSHPLPAATPSAPQRAVRLSAPPVAAPVLGSRPVRPAAADRRPGDIEGYFHEINTASTDDERHRIGKRYDIRMIPG